ncbi:MAG TPA: hypothetical protein VHZ03_52900, partial [Trebonia sp.]|nr:hypothetical protein [Trebonia sp.]
PETGHTRALAWPGHGPYSGVPGHEPETGKKGAKPLLTPARSFRDDLRFPKMILVTGKSHVHHAWCDFTECQLFAITST